MRNLAIVVAVGIVVAVVLAVLAKSRTTPSAAENYIHFVVVLSSPVELDPSKLTADYQHDWGARIACEENKSLANPQQQTKSYLATDGQSGVLIVVSALPLPGTLVNATSALSNLGAGDRAALQAHNAFIRVEYATGSAAPKERARLASHVALSLLHMPQALGYINVSGQSYRTENRAQPLIGCDDDEALFLACTSVQDVTAPGDYWMHTHGMEQFGLPDIEVKFQNGQQVSYFEDLVANCALYLLKNGPILKVGDTAELAGDGINYRIQAADADPEHEFGHYGAIKLSRMN